MRQAAGLLGVVLAAMLFATPAFAAKEYSGTAHVAFDRPDAWQRAVQNTTVVVGSPDTRIVFEVDYVTTTAQAQAGVAQLTATLGKFQSVTTDGPPRDIVQGGMKGRQQSGKLSRGGKTLRYFAAFLGHDSGGAVILAFLQPDASQAELTAAQNVLGSFRKE
jgi:hypothetical protein